MPIFPRHQAHKIITLLITSIVILVPLTYWPAMRDYTLSPKLFVLQILLALILLTWLFSSTKPFQIPTLCFPALTFLFIALTSTLWATHAEMALIENTKYVAGFIFFLILANHLTSHNIPPILIASVSTGVLVALLIVCDYLGTRPINIPSAGLPSATLGYRNIAAMYLIQIVPFAIAMFILAKNHYTALFNAIAISIIGASIIYTRTRGAWLGLIVALLIVGILWYWQTNKEKKPLFNKPIWYFVGASILFMGLLLLPPGLTKKGPQSIDEKKTSVTTAVSSILQEGGDRGRLTTWRNTLRIIEAYPILGVGLGNWSVYYPYYDRGEQVTFQVAPERPHNTLLAIFSELGLVGLICFLWFCVSVIKAGLSLIKAPSPTTRTIAGAGLTSFIAILIHSIFSFPLERATPTVFFWFAPGLFVGLQSNRNKHVPRITFPAIAILLLAVIAQLVLTYRLAQFENHMYRAVKAEHASNWAQVSTETQKALTFGTLHPEALHLHGYALNALGQYTASKSHYQKAVQKRPFDVQTLNGLAIAAQNLGDTHTAKTRYQQILTIVNSPDIHYNLASLFLQTGHPDSAVTAYRQVIQMEGPSLDLHYHLAYAYFFNQQSAQAQKILQAAFSHDSEATKHFEWIEALYRKYQNTAIVRTCYAVFIQHGAQDTQSRETAQRRLKELQTLP
jgi:O-antigen ligase/tetratricopeptide (TPR) repeat protein